MHFYLDNIKNNFQHHKKHTASLIWTSTSCVFQENWSRFIRKIIWNI